MMMNIGSIPTKPLSVPATDAAPINKGIGAPTKEREDKWKTTKKINRIYVDWIDDLTPPQSLPRENF